MIRTTTFKATVAAISLATVTGLSGCSSAGEGAFSGAGIGALTGLVLGSFSGDAGEGALIGTAAGAVIGGVIGDQNQRDASYSRQEAEAYRSGRVIYRDAPREPERPNDRWGNRYGQTAPQQTTYTEYRYYESRPQPRVIVQYNDHHSYRSWPHYPRHSSYSYYSSRRGHHGRYGH